jgi:hypothetical protein
MSPTHESRQAQRGPARAIGPGNQRSAKVTRDHMTTQVSARYGQDLYASHADGANSRYGVAPGATVEGQPGGQS